MDQVSSLLPLFFVEQMPFILESLITQSQFRDWDDIQILHNEKSKLRLLEITTITIHGPPIELLTS